MKLSDNFTLTACVPGRLETSPGTDKLAVAAETREIAGRIAPVIAGVKDKCARLKDIGDNPVDEVLGARLTGQGDVENVEIIYTTDGEEHSHSYTRDQFDAL